MGGVRVHSFPVLSAVKTQIPQQELLYFKSLFSTELVFDGALSALTSASPDFPVQPFQGRKEVVLTTLTWFGGQNHFLPIAYLVTGGVVLLVAVALTVIWWRFGRNGKNMEE